MPAPPGQVTPRASLPELLKLRAKPMPSLPERERQTA